MTRKEKFYKVYSNLPIPLRREIVVVIDKEPISWSVAKIEIDGGTELGEKILEQLSNFKFI